MKNFLHQKEKYIIFIILYISYTNAQSDTFHEELILKPLPSGYIYAFFQFTTIWEASNSLHTRTSTFYIFTIEFIASIYL